MGLNPVKAITAFNFKVLFSLENPPDLVDYCEFQEKTEYQEKILMHNIWVSISSSFVGTGEFKLPISLNHILRTINP